MVYQICVTTMKLATWHLNCRMTPMTFAELSRESQLRNLVANCELLAYDPYRRQRLSRAPGSRHPRLHPFLYHIGAWQPLPDQDPVSYYSQVMGEVAQVRLARGVDANGRLASSSSACGVRRKVTSLPSIPWHVQAAP